MTTPWTKRLVPEATDIPPHTSHRAEEAARASTASSTPDTKQSGRFDPPVSQAANPLFGVDAKKGRRRSGQQLRSPVVKRLQSAPVTLKGWLYKQGSDGLMLWKKRWFVLSEYCLFYYKDSEEGKVLGSILLPSYKISPCCPEDRIFRKFAFKAEHQNMRTYYFSADTREMMVQWMNALSLASILQRPDSWDECRSGGPCISSTSSLLNQSADGSDSGYPRGHSPQLQLVSMADEADENTLDLVANSWTKIRQGYQPLYANAPPKPKRLNNSRDYSTSPDRTPERERRCLELTSSKSPELQNQVNQQQTQQDEMLLLNSRRDPSVGDRYLRKNEQVPMENRTSYHYRVSIMQAHPGGPYRPQHIGQPMERRTPDTYGRSNNSRGDYEDIYNNGSNFTSGKNFVVSSTSGSNRYRVDPPPYLQVSKSTKQQGSPQHHAEQCKTQPQVSTSVLNPVQRRNATNFIMPLGAVAMPVQTIPKVSQRTKLMPRPHSADFLEHDSMTYSGGEYTSGVTMRSRDRNPVKEQPPRPKSSVDNYDSNDYWSEESYAQKMRQSLYNQKNQTHVHSSPKNVSLVQQPVMLGELKSSGSDSASGKDKSGASEINVVLPVHNQVQSQTYSKEQDKCSYDPTNSPDPQTLNKPQDGSTSAVKVNLDSQWWNEYKELQRNQFVRSASARLPRSHEDDDPPLPAGVEAQRCLRDGERKIQQREESMKRLLEWKQRMLQSPLTRKPSPRLPDSRHSPVSQYHKQQVLQALADHEAWNREELGSDTRARRLTGWRDMGRPTRSRSHDGRRSSLNRHNSYSSDDEEFGDVREARRRVRKSSQAGRARRSSMENKRGLGVNSSLASGVTHHSYPSSSQNYANDDIPAELTENVAGSSLRKGLGQLVDGTFKYELTENGIPPDASYVDSYMCASSGDKNIINYNSQQNVDMEGKIRMHENNLYHDSKIHHLQTPHKDKYQNKEVPKGGSVLSKLTNSEDKFDLKYSNSNSKFCLNSIQSNYSPGVQNKSVAFEQKHITPQRIVSVESQAWVKDKNDSNSFLSHEFSLQLDGNANGKHSDSGYDTLRQSIISGDGIHYEDNVHSVSQNSHSERENFPGHSASRKPYGSKEENKTGETLDGFKNTRVFIKNQSQESWSDFSPTAETLKPVRYHQETPPRNLVQDRIKAFESSSKEESALERMRKSIEQGVESVQMQEPLKLSLSMHRPSEAHVSNLRKGENNSSSDQKNRDARNNSKESFKAHSSLKKTIISSKGLPSAQEIADLRSSRRSSLRNFAFGGSESDKSQVNNIEVPRKVESTSCSNLRNTACVENVQTDFGSKSQLIASHKIEAVEDSMRCMNSDVDELLYDTYMDDKFQPSFAKKSAATRDSDLFDSICSTGNNASNIGKCDNLLHEVKGKSNPICSDSMSQKIDTALTMAPNDTSRREESGIGSDSADLEIIVTPGYLRLSLAESLEGNASHGTLSQLKVAMDSYQNSNDKMDRETCNTFQYMGKREEESESKETQNNEGSTLEEQYVPMTPSRKPILAPPEPFLNSNCSHKRSLSASETVIVENIFAKAQLEESTYVEMTEDGLPRSLIASHKGDSILAGMDAREINPSEYNLPTLKSESPRYCEIMDRDEASHYEFLYHATSQYEPVYMEVCPVLDMLKLEGKETQTESKTISREKVEKKNTVCGAIPSNDPENDVDKSPVPPPRTALPDILTISAQKHKSDSSDADADDEASKDLDSLDTPRHPRFSLSDTFRPASYYLGATDRSGGSENQDSSDSDLVSPPPIPTSPPPMDDLDECSNQKSDMDSFGDIQISDEHLKTHCSIEEDAHVSENEPKSTKGCNITTGASCKLSSHASSNAESSNSKQQISSKFSLTHQIDCDGWYSNNETDRNINFASKKEISNIFSELNAITSDAGSRILIRELEPHDMYVGLQQSDNSVILSQACEDSHQDSRLHTLTAGKDVLHDNDFDLKEVICSDVDTFTAYQKDLKTFYKTAVNDNVVHNSSYISSTSQKDRIAQSPHLMQVHESRNTLKGSSEDFVGQGLLQKKVQATHSQVAVTEENEPDHCINQSLSNAKRYCESPVRGNSLETCVEGPQYENLQWIPNRSVKNPISYRFEKGNGIIPDHLADRTRSTELSFVAEERDSSLSKHQQKFSETVIPPHTSSQRLESIIVDDSSQLNSSERNVVCGIGAPYYYSDLLRGEDDGFASSTSERSVTRSYIGNQGLGSMLSQRNRLHQLNNQRGDLEAFSKRNDIGRKVNQIQSYPTQPASLQVADMPEPQARLHHMAVDLQSSVEFLGGRKSDDIDVRNIYESDTLRKITRRQHLQQHEHFPHNSDSIELKNCYPTGLKDKTDIEFPALTPTNLVLQGRRRSRSLEGLLDDNSSVASSQIFSNAQNYVVSPAEENMQRVSDTNRERSLTAVSTQSQAETDRSNPNVSDLNAEDDHGQSSAFSTESTNRRRCRTSSFEQSVPCTSTSRADTTVSCEGGDMWEEDTLWRENLRRASMRHTRSLDNLDDKDEKRPGKLLGKTASDQKNQSSGRHSADLLSSENERCSWIQNAARSADGKTKQSERKKLSRDVTYVNQNVARSQVRARQEYEVDYREGRRRQNIQRNEDDSQYERLSQYSESLERTRRGHTYLEEYVWDSEEEKFRKEDGNVLSSQRRNFLGKNSPASFEIDREQLRQWDLMSSAPLQGTESAGIPHQKKKSSESEVGAAHGVRQGDIQNGAASDETKKQFVPGHQEESSTHAVKENREGPMMLPTPPASASGSVHDPLIRQVQSLEKPLSWIGQPSNLSDIRGNPGSMSDSEPYANKQNEQDGMSNPWGLNVSAGDLLGRTHEELVLFLIQLRRQSATVCKAMEMCHMEIESQSRLIELESPKRLEHLQKLEELKRHLQELEKQYEKGKPLVNLVDNMVKLGSLYKKSTQGSDDMLRSRYLAKEKLEFNQKIQEQRLLAEEQKDWNKLNPDHNELQAKVQQLYHLDQLLQEESVTIQCLQQDKEFLERALGGLKHKLQGNRDNPVEVERCRKQQKVLERELSRVRLLLAHNSKKLEETVAENARLEQELLVLRQKLQLSWRVDSNMSALDQNIPESTTSALEAELRRIQVLVGDLQRQRQELSMQVRQLTEKSHTLVQQIRPGPTGVAGAGPVPAKKRHHSSWLETDLDSLVSLDRGIEIPVAPVKVKDLRTPLYVNTGIERPAENQDKALLGVKSPGSSCDSFSGPPPSTVAEPAVNAEEAAQYYHMDISEADDRMKRYYGIIPREKQEIKTVRIVKRESERRQRDRTKRVTIDDPSLGRVQEEDGEELDYLLEEDPAFIQFQRSMSLPRGFGKQKYHQSLSEDQSLSAHERLFGSNQDQPEYSPNSSPSRCSSNGSQQLSPLESPVYKSAAAREIVMELSREQDERKRAVPKEKRRHHTVSSIHPVAMETLEALKMGSARSRDDLDMERVLRPRLNAPDVVRSTMSHKDFKYNEYTIDNVLGTPNKILIPERYIPEQAPELSAEEQLHRLKKADAIRKMLSETTSISAPEVEVEDKIEEEEKTSTLKKKVAEEKKQREHLLQLNQILAKQVMEKSKMVAGTVASSNDSRD